MLFTYCSDISITVIKSYHNIFSFILKNDTSIILLIS